MQSGSVELAHPMLGLGLGTFGMVKARAKWQGNRVIVGDPQGTRGSAALRDRPWWSIATVADWLGAGAVATVDAEGGLALPLWGRQ